MAKKTDKESNGKTEVNLKYITDLEDLPTREGGVREIGWLRDAPKGAVFSPKFLVESGVYTTSAAACAALARNSRNKWDAKHKKTVPVPEAADMPLEMVRRGVYRKVIAPPKA